MKKAAIRQLLHHSLSSLCVTLSLTHLGELNYTLVELHYASSLSFRGAFSLPSWGTHLFPLRISVLIAVWDYRGHRLLSPSRISLQTLMVNSGWFLSVEMLEQCKESARRDGCFWVENMVLDPVTSSSNAEVIHRRSRTYLCLIIYWSQPLAWINCQIAFQLFQISKEIILMQNEPQSPRRTSRSNPLQCTKKQKWVEINATSCRRGLKGSFEEETRLAS